MNRTQSGNLAKLYLKPSSSVHLPIKDSPISRANLHTAERLQKLSKVELSCIKIQGDLKLTKKLASQRINKDLQGLAFQTQTYDDSESSWKKELKMLKAKREENMRQFDSLKGLKSIKFSEKEPIKRMKAKNEFPLQETKQVSLSDVSSIIGKRILSSSKRNFGEVFLKKNNSETEFGSRRLGSVEEIRKKKNDLQTCKAGEKEIKLLDKVRKVPMLAKQIKHCKKTGKKL